MLTVAAMFVLLAQLEALVSRTATVLEGNATNSGSANPFYEAIRFRFRQIAVLSIQLLINVDARETILLGLLSHSLPFPLTRLGWR